ncbi:MAG TPA: RNA polymerase subunit sigma [Gammaproteobacteria bacterium]|nr:RNA polymerase subunit sigma [Gammaproteobacteria bacterium]
MNKKSHPHTDPNTWLDQHGDALYRFALVRVRDSAVAEDLVQDTLLAALRAHERFAGQSSELTWLIAILKNKIVDHYRRHVREAPLPESEDPDGLIDALFKKSNDHWLTVPAAWQDPDTSLENSQFWQAFTDCLQGLPARQAQAFTLTELDGLGTDELCKVLGVTSSNVWVLLHRARLRLRECLEHGWFGNEARDR